MSDDVFRAPTITIETYRCIFEFYQKAASQYGFTIVVLSRWKVPVVNIPKVKFVLIGPAIREDKRRSTLFRLGD